MRLSIAFAGILLGAAAGVWPQAGRAAATEAHTTSPLGVLVPVSHLSGAQGADVYRQIARLEAAKAGLPFDLADAVMKVESDYDPTRIGGVGEIGLMQVRPQTAAMLGFKGNAGDLATPQTNIHYGIAYLARAWQLANGDVCRALMKYRAGHGEETMTEKSVTYCARAKAHLASRGSPLAQGGVPIASLAGPAFGKAAPGRARGPLHGAAFWAAQEARVRRLTAALHAKWRMAAR